MDGLKSGTCRICAAVAIVCGSLAAQNSLDLATKAEQQLRQGNKPAALASLQQAETAPGTSAPSEDKIGFLLAVLGDAAGAHEHFRKALSFNNNYAAAHYHLGAADWLAGEQQEGLRELAMAVHLAPDVFEYRYRLGAAYLEGGDPGKAVDELKQAILLPGAKQGAWRSLGQALQAKNDAVGAIEAYQKALQLKDDNFTRDAFATLLIQTRQPAQGIEQANIVLARDPRDFTAYMNLGYAYLKTGEYAKAEAAYRTASANNGPAAAPHYDLGIALKMQDHLDAAREEFQKAIELDPTMAEAEYSLGIIAWQSGDFASMITAMKEAARIRPEYAEAHYMLGIGLKGTGDLDGAVAELREAVKLDPATPGPYNTIGQILRQKGDRQGSADAFAVGARLKKEKDAQLSNNLDQGMRGGEMPSPITRPAAQ